METRESAIEAVCVCGTWMQVPAGYVGHEWQCWVCHRVRPVPSSVYDPAEWAAFGRGGAELASTPGLEPVHCRPAWAGGAGWGPPSGGGGGMDEGDDDPDDSRPADADAAWGSTTIYRAVTWPMVLVLALAVVPADPLPALAWLRVAGLGLAGVALTARAGAGRVFASRWWWGLVRERGIVPLIHLRHSAGLVTLVGLVGCVLAGPGWFPLPTAAGGWNLVAWTAAAGVAAGLGWLAACGDEVAG